MSRSGEALRVYDDTFIEALAAGNSNTEAERKAMAALVATLGGQDDEPGLQGPAADGRVGVLAPGPFTPEGRLTASRLPGGKVAMAVHRGDYARLGDTHAAVRAYLDAQGLEVAGPIWEIYGHWRSNPDELETEIYHLLRPS